MTISSEDYKAGPFYSGANLPFEFKVFQNSDVRVVSADADGVETDLTEGPDYTISLNVDQNNSPGGTVVLAVAVVFGESATVVSRLVYTQDADITNQGGYYPEVIEDALDRNVRLIQQLREEQDRTLRFPVSDPAVSSQLPPAADRANKYLAFDENGAPVGSAQSIEALAASAAGSAAAASASEDNAAASEAAAALSELNAAASKASAVATAGSVSATASALKPTVTNYSGDGLETDFTLPYVVTAEEQIEVYVDGVYQSQLTYAINVDGVTLEFDTAPASGTDNIEVRTASNFTYFLPVTLDYGLVTEAVGSTEDYGALV